MNSFHPFADLPLGLGMTLCRKAAAMERFGSLSPDEQRRMIDGAQPSGSPSELQSFFRDLTGQYDL